MVTKVSKAGTGMYITALSGILTIIGIDIDEGLLTEAFIAVLQGAGALLWVYGQIARKDMEWGMFRKKMPES